MFIKTNPRFDKPFFLSVTVAMSFKPSIYPWYIKQCTIIMVADLALAVISETTGR